MAEGKNLGEALTDVDVESIAVSAVAGALSGGLSTISKFKTANKVVKTVVEVTVDASASAANQAVTTGEIDPVNLAIDVAAAQYIGKAVSHKVETNAKSSPEGKVLAREANRTNRIAGNRPNRQARASKAQEKFDSHGKARAAAAGAASAGVGSTIIKKAKEKSSGGGGRRIEYGEITYPTGDL